jgi:hypothetical protein
LHRLVEILGRDDKKGLQVSSEGCAAAAPERRSAARLRQAATSFGVDLPGPPEAPRSRAGALSIEEETERIERIVLRTFEKFFSSKARNTAGRD